MSNLDLEVSILNETGTYENHIAEITANKIINYLDRAFEIAMDMYELFTEFQIEVDLDNKKRTQGVPKIYIKYWLRIISSEQSKIN